MSRVNRGRAAPIDYRERSHQGLVRPTNQDEVAVFRTGWDVPALIAAVADGMGGHNGGAHASQSVLAHLRKRLAGVALRLAAYGDEWQDELTEILLQAVEGANAALWAEAQSDPELHGMGTTLVLAVFVDGWCGVVHAGDSRAFRSRGSGIVQLTIDHSWGEEQRRLGRSTTAEIADAPHRGHLIRAMGVAPTVEPEVTWCRLQKGDLVLLCSDGLTNHVSAPEIAWFLKRAALDADQALLDAALARGGHDNVSVVLLRQSAAPTRRLPQPRGAGPGETWDDRWYTYPPVAPGGSRSRSSVRLAVSLGGALLLALAVLAGSAVWLLRPPEPRAKGAAGVDAPVADSVHGAGQDAGPPADVRSPEDPAPQSDSSAAGGPAADRAQAILPDTGASAKPDPEGSPPAGEGGHLGSLPRPSPVPTVPR